MSLNVTFNGSMFIIPETGEVGWGGNTTSYLVAIAAGALQKTGGSFTLSAEIDFGASFGIKSLYYKSRSANVAAAGILRLNNNSDSISWRNFANSGDLPLLVNASNELLYNGNQVLTGTGPSSYVSSITGTANQVIASGATGAVTLSLPQSIATSSNVQFGTLGLGSAVVASSILSLTSTTLGFLPPRLTTTERDAIISPATGLFIYNTTTGVNNYYNGTLWVAIAAGGTINAGLQYQLGYYAAAGTTLSGLPLITGLRALESDANGLPVASSVTSTELGYLSGVTSAIQTQLTGKASTALSNLASVAINTTLVSDTDNTDDLGTTGIAWKDIFLKGALKSAGTTLATVTELGYLTGVTSAIQTQLNGKASTALSNLASVAINTTLVSDTDNTDDLGTSAINWKDLYMKGDVKVGSTTAIDLASSGAVSIRGTNTNDSPATGFVGEVVSAETGFANVATTGQFSDITSISLTAGDWLISGMADFDQNGSTWEQARLFISVNPGNDATGEALGRNSLQCLWLSSALTPNTATPSIPSLHVQLSATTTYYLKKLSSYSAGTPQAAGRITAVRIR